MQDERNRRTQIEGDASNMGIKSLVVRFVGVMILLPVLLLQPLPAQSPTTGTLTIRVVGASNAGGEIRVALFQNAQGFPADASKAFRTQPAQINRQTLSAEVRFTGIPQGVYAVSVFHDENGNGKLDKSLVGIPKEAYGASNNPRKRCGHPRSMKRSSRSVHSKPLRSS